MDGWMDGCAANEGVEFADAAARQGRQTGRNGEGAAAPAWAAVTQRQNGQNGDEPPLQNPEGNTKCGKWGCLKRLIYREIESDRRTFN